MYTVCLDAERSKRPALLFQGLEIDKVAQDPGIHNLFPHGYFVKAVGEGNPQRYRYGSEPERPIIPKLTLVTTVLSTELPDKAALDHPDILFYIQGVKHTINLRARYNQCLSLFKAVGCCSCPEKGARCISEGAGVEIPASVEVALDGEDLLERLLENKTNIAGHDFVNPTATRVKDFTGKLRPYWQHDFDDIKKNQEELSDRATKGAQTKKFKKTQCVKCVINKSCTSSSHCKGAFPPEQEIIEMAARRMLETIKESKVPAWQLWELARGMGETAKHSRWNIILTGLKLQGTDGLVPTVHRAKGSIDIYGGLKTYEDIAKVFKLPLTEAECTGGAHGPVTNLEVLATWWLTLNTPHAHQSYGWGCRRYLCGIGVANRAVTLQWTNGKYLSYGGELEKVADVAAHLSYGRLADIQKVEIR